MAFATALDLAVYFDEMQLRDLVSDSGTPASAISGNPVVTAALNAGAGQVRAAVFNARIYTEAELLALTGDARALLTLLNCQAAVVILMGRRPEKYGTEHLDAMRMQLEDYLDRLRKGERMFDMDRAAEAGLPSVDGPVAVDVQNMNLITTRTKKYYPQSAARLPLGRGFGL